MTSSSTYSLTRDPRQLTALMGKLGRLAIDGELGCGSLDSLAAIACCNCSYFGPLKYRSKQSKTFCPVLLKTSTASWLEYPCKECPSTSTTRSFIRIILLKSAALPLLILFTKMPESSSVNCKLNVQGKLYEFAKNHRLVDTFFNLLIFFFAPQPKFYSLVVEGIFYLSRRRILLS